MGGNVAAREFVAQYQLHVGRHAQLHQAQVGVGEMTARLFIEEDGRFQRRPGQPVFDARRGVPQVEPSRGTLAFGEQAPQPPAQHAGAREVGLACVGPHQEDRRLIGQRLDGGVELRQILADFNCGHHRFAPFLVRALRTPVGYPGRGSDEKSSSVNDAIRATTFRGCEEMRPQAGVGKLKRAPPMQANDLPVVAQAVSPACRIFSRLLREWSVLRRTPAPYSLTAFESISARISARKSAIDFTPWSACLRLRTATMPFSCSRSPTTSMYGIFCSWASRIFRFTFSLRSSTVARIPAASSCFWTSCAYAAWRSVMGRTMACTGASQTGNAPA